MPERTICKFRCVSIQPPDGNSKRVHFRTQYDNTLPEDQRFCTATPDGEMSVLIANPALKGFFQEGKNYYVEVYPAE